VCLTLSEIRSKNFTSVTNQCKRQPAKRATKGFDLKAATAIRKTDLDDSYARCALANKIDAATERAASVKTGACRMANYSAMMSSTIPAHA